MPDLPLLNIKQVAELLNLSPATIRSLVRQGQLRAHKLGRNWRFDAMDVRGAVRQSMIEPSNLPRVA